MLTFNIQYSRLSKTLGCFNQLYSLFPFEEFCTMSEKKKPVIGLQWQPKLPTLSLSSSSSTANINGASDTNKKKGVNESSQNRGECGSALYRPSSELVDGLFVPSNDPKKLNKLLKKQVKDNAGSSWFDMPAATITPELKKDLQLLKLRGAIDPKRHYKKGDSKSKALPKYFQVGSVIESSTDFFSSRLTKKERKATFADELLSDPNIGQYRKRKVREIEEQNHPAGNDKWKIRGRQTQKRKKQSRH